MKRAAIILFTFVIGLKVNAQITTQNTMTPNQLVQSVLVGQGVVVSNVKYNGSIPNAQVLQGNALSFSSSNFPFSSGVYMRTDGGNGLVNDQDLNDIATNDITNGCIIEFDFVPSGDTISFRYMFASLEYPSYACSDYNDVFGFFISGPGFAGPFQNSGENIALIPGGNIPVAINTVNSGSAGIFGDPDYCSGQDPNWQANSVYYTTAYSGTGGYPYNGGTVVMTSNASVQCGETYHIKLAIANVGDEALDSGVFLEADSFASDAVDIAVATVSGDTSVIEGCTDATFIFTRPTTQVNDTMIVDYQITGNATMGSDYNNLPNPVIFLPGEDTIIITLSPTQDGSDENPESVVLTATTITDCGDTIVTTGTLYIIDGPTLNINESDLNIACPNDSVVATATASGGFGPYVLTWPSVMQTGTTAYLPALTNGTYNFVVNAIDACGNTGTDTVTIVLNQTLKIDTMEMTQASACQNNGVVVGMGSGFTGQPLYHWQGPGSTGTSQIDASVMQNLSSGWYYFTITDNVCSVNDSIFLTQDPPPVANFTSSATSGCSPLTVTLTNTSENATFYQWTFGNGNTLNTADLSTPITQTYNDDGIVTLIATKGPCADTTEFNITISVCGCTDPNALNYNPLAEVDDNSCLYPDPTVEVPNVFSPNGDGSNDVFFIKTTYATSVEYTIVDRWGITMFEGSGVSAAWNGDGASDGVYFYSYTVKGLLGKEITGQGFVQLFR